MKVTIIAVGKIKEKYIIEGIREYEKRLKGYVELNIVEVPDVAAPENLSEAGKLKVLHEEGQKILSKLPSGKTYALAINGKTYSSEQLAKRFENDGIMGDSQVNFIIGGSLGLSDEVYEKCDEKISFSALTFPHQLMRLIFVEQLYRAYRIINGHPYHK
ncbi:MAG: 23S rRNA (pseudouridine(1915)-N(3))-methyltransferase RlmH [Tissierellia bacterium]|nr:23S rRNA (pseudouridine(1915)-N(3))-methyltransferase RlmH [Tissierellia bacterium]